MAESQDNPFKRALSDSKTKDASARLKPFRTGPAQAGSLPKRDQLRTVAEMGIADPEVLSKNPRVAQLTAHDLNDLARQFSGIPTYNPNIADLTIEDMQDIEGVFIDFKLGTARDLGDLAAGARAVEVDVSCCCCTPCCCCAAAEVDPVPA